MIKSIVRTYFVIGLLSMLSCSKIDELIELPPESVTLIYPENNKACEQGFDKGANLREVDFQWSVSANTKSYDLLINDLNDQSVAYFEQDIYETNKKVSLEKGKPYSWQVISKSESSNLTTKSDFSKMYLIGEGVTNSAPFPADLIFPKLGEKVQRDNGKVKLLWTSSDADGDDLKYTVYLDKIDGKQPPIEIYSNLASQELEVAVEPNSIYYWRIKSGDSKNSSFSPIYRFITD